jgi:uncharacterized protein YjbI with pentapeptide repeats
MSDAAGAASTPGGTAAAPDKAELERQQLALNIERLKIETRKLERDTRPEAWWTKIVKNIVAIGGILTVAGTAFGVYDSYNKTITDRERTRVADRRVRFEDAIKRLESASTISKLVGVSVLSGYLTAGEKESHRQIFFTLAGLMATEKDFQTQAAVIDLVTAIPKEGQISPEDWTYFQDTLVSHSRALMSKGDLLRHRHFQSASPLTDDEKAARTIGKLIAVNARKGAVEGYAKYRGIYCADCDFHGAKFPDATDFTGAVLDRANFSGATLKDARFDNAEIAGTTFVQTDLRGASFRSTTDAIAIGDGENTRTLLDRTQYLDHIASALDVNAIIDMRMPNFSCANLEGANFDGHALFPGVLEMRRSFTKADLTKPGWYQSIPVYLKERLDERPKVEFLPQAVRPPKFLKANLKGVNLKDIQFFSVDGLNDPPSYMSSSKGIRVAELIFSQGQMGDDAFQTKPDSDNAAAKKKTKEEQEAEQQNNRDLRFFQGRTRGAFFMAELDGALFPDNMRGFFHGVSRSEYNSAFRPLPFGASADADFDCTPRRN